MLFVPFLDTTTESYLDAYWIDVRNGYLYGQTVSVQKEQSDSHTIYSDPSAEALERQWAALVAETRTRLTDVVSSGQKPPTEVASPALAPGAPLAAPPPLPAASSPLPIAPAPPP